MTQPVVKIFREDGVGLPRYGTGGAAGFDLEAHISEPLTLQPGQRVVIPTGVCLAIPEGYEGQMRPRSGLASKHGIGMVNAPATIDSDYRGMVHAILINLGQEPYTFKRGDRICQMVIVPATKASIEEVADVDGLGTTGRGTGGMGSTGR